MTKQVVVRIFNAETINVNDTSLTVLRLEKESRVNAKDFYDLLADMKERYKSTPNKIIVLAKLGRGSTEAEHVATISTIERGILLFPEPTRLKAIYIAGDDLKPGIKYSLSLLKRIELSDIVYVYQGEVVFGDKVRLIVLETEKGVKVITRQMLRK